MFPIRIAACLALVWAAPRAATLGLDPVAVVAGRASMVAVSGLSNACAPIISHPKVEVSGSTLSLSAVFENNPVLARKPVDAAGRRDAADRRGDARP